ncbi:hypothetical protein I317_06072 [Kwoniella heveanensis CBS 569]|uniref:Uncharacterized protein n=1 Tax=Kwoniella heveanensis BCC8398 TaxID=1296120 RepID=A0A1B9GNP1_9TREE|nr:hypothetical protein I316_05593 [Kwoniella heveanensis BCC8398]OCF40121.1 hypothetical protein I317_06072 [Kwoniella heveanensis CBS 569]
MSAPVSFTPRHVQPFTLEEAMQLEVETLVAEINRLRNSIAHLRESQSELNEFLQSEEGQSDPLERSGEGEISKAVRENEGVISSQNERIALITIALSNKLGSETRLEHYGLKIENDDSRGDGGTSREEGVNVDGLDAVRALSRLQAQPHPQSQGHGQRGTRVDDEVAGAGDGDGDGIAIGHDQGDGDQGGLHL